MFSSVFHAASTFDLQKRQVSFADTDIETAAVLRLFLTVITKGHIGPYDTKTTKSMFPVVFALHFMKKYECAVAQAILFLDIKVRLLQNGYYAVLAFILGAINDDLEICKLSLVQAGILVWGNNSKLDSLEGAISGAPIIHPGALPFEIWHLIPQHYIWALTRASYGNSNVTAAQLPDRFCILIREHRGRFACPRTPTNTKARFGRHHQPEVGA
jgi:hypothetical protein